MGITVEQYTQYTFLSVETEPAPSPGCSCGRSCGSARREKLTKKFQDNQTIKRKLEECSKYNLQNVADESLGNAYDLSLKDKEHRGMNVDDLVSYIEGSDKNSVKKIVKKYNDKNRIQAKRNKKLGKAFKDTSCKEEEVTDTGSDQDVQETNNSIQCNTNETKSISYSVDEKTYFASDFIEKKQKFSAINCPTVVSPKKHLEDKMVTHPHITNIRDTPMQVILACNSRLMKDLKSKESNDKQTDSRNVLYSSTEVKDKIYKKSIVNARASEKSYTGSYVLPSASFPAISETFVAKRNMNSAALAATQKKANGLSSKDANISSSIVQNAEIPSSIVEGIVAKTLEEVNAKLDKLNITNQSEPEDKTYEKAMNSRLPVGYAYDAYLDRTFKTFNSSSWRRICNNIMMEEEISNIQRNAFAGSMDGWMNFGLGVQSNFNYGGSKSLSRAEKAGADKVFNIWPTRQRNSSVFYAVESLV